ncbi:MAG: hypothetical protein V1688_03430 [bacterium]
MNYEMNIALAVSGAVSARWRRRRCERAMFFAFSIFAFAPLASVATAFSLFFLFRNSKDYNDYLMDYDLFAPASESPSGDSDGALILKF